MFLDTMSPEAIIKEARRDTTAIQNKRDFFINTHRREILFCQEISRIIPNRMEIPSHIQQMAHYHHVQ